MGVKYGETSKAASNFYFSNSFSILLYFIQFMIWCSRF
jgi:hypothetical protein